MERSLDSTNGLVLDSVGNIYAAHSDTPRTIKVYNSSGSLQRTLTNINVLEFIDSADRLVCINATGLGLERRNSVTGALVDSIANIDNTTVYDSIYRNGYYYTLHRGVVSPYYLIVRKIDPASLAIVASITCSNFYSVTVFAGRCAWDIDPYDNVYYVTKQASGAALY